MIYLSIALIVSSTFSFVYFNRKLNLTFDDVETKYSDAVLGDLKQTMKDVSEVKEQLSRLEMRLMSR